METFRKKINLEPLKNRYINKGYTNSGEETYLNKIPYYLNNEFYDDNLSWGGECVDLLIRVYQSKDVNSNEIACFSILYDSTISKKIPMMMCDINCLELSRNEITKEYFYKNDGQIYTSGARYFYIRYKNLIEYYNWVIKVFIPSCKFYKVCKNGYRLTKKTFNDRLVSRSSVFFDDYSIDIVTDLPNINENNYEIGKIICATPHKDEMIDRFGSIEIMGGFVLFCNNIFNYGIDYLNTKLRGRNVKDVYLTHKTPYFTIPLVITKSDIEVGVYSDCVETWIPKKKYYLGDVVYYNGETYMLNKADKGDYDITYISDTLYTNNVFNNSKYITGLTITDVEKYTGFTYNNNVNASGNNKDEDYMISGINKKIVITNKGKHGIVQPYHCGVYDSVTKITSFSTKYWVKIEQPFFAERPKIDNGYDSIVESRLTDYKRKQVSVDDCGEILPFLIKYKKSNGSFELDVFGNKKMEINTDGNVNTILPYKVGIVYEKNNDDNTTTIDRLIEISFIDGVGVTKKRFTTNQDILFTDVPDDCKFMKFTYLNGEIVGDKGKILSSGIKYFEKYEIKKSVFTPKNKIDKQTITFDYIDFDIKKCLITLNNLNADVFSLTDNPIYSNIEVKKEMIEKSNTTSFSPIFKKESLIGVINENNNIDATLTRGTSAALERHQNLGEVKTLQDLQNFKNNYFEI